MKITRNLLFLATVAVLLGAAQPSKAGPITIDDYTVPITGNPPQTAVSFTNGSTGTNTLTGIPTANTLGGSRNLSVTSQLQTGLEAQIRAGGGSNVLTFTLDTQSPSTTASTASVLYNANGVGLNTDLTGGGTNVQFVVQVTSSTSDTPVNITIKATDTSSDVGSVTVTVPANQGNTPLALLFAFSDPGFTGVNFNSISSVEMDLSGLDSGHSISINLLEVTGPAEVPEPSSLALSGILGLGFGGYLWRRRRQKSLPAVPEAVTAPA